MNNKYIKITAVRNKSEGGVFHSLFAYTVFRNRFISSDTSACKNSFIALFATPCPDLSMPNPHKQQ